ncbi:hypothetical protein GCM10023156_52870 [Novipirellula rosea]|uniref:Uncharacterized protein n=1 Tax=Novipirellula rosea TaxID=1031540 RepID=A0ABP8ND01_9BACT
MEVEDRNGIFICEPVVLAGAFVAVGAKSRGDNGENVFEYDRQFKRPRTDNGVMYDSVSY